jgi:hypothetical protein
MTQVVPRKAIAIIVHHRYHSNNGIACVDERFDKSLYSSTNERSNLPGRKQQLVRVALTHRPGLSQARNKGRIRGPG